MANASTHEIISSPLRILVLTPQSTAIPSILKGTRSLMYSHSQRCKTKTVYLDRSHSSSLNTLLQRHYSHLARYSPAVRARATSMGRGVEGRGCRGSRTGGGSLGCCAEESCSGGYRWRYRGGETDPNYPVILAC